MTAITAWRTDEPCPVCATGLILHDDGTSPPRAECRLCGWSDTWTGDHADGGEPVTEPAARPRTTRAERMTMPLARQVVKDLAVEHGACIRPIQLRRTNLDTGEVDQVLVPCGHTLAHVCPSCAERARTLRAVQCREGWHLEDEPDLTPDPATDDQQWWVTMRADAQQTRDQADDGRAGHGRLRRAHPRAGRGDRQVRRPRERRPRTSPPGGTGRPAAARTPPTCPGARSIRAPWARPTPRRTARRSARRCSSR